MTQVIDVDAKAHTAEIEYDDTRVNLETIKSQLAEGGYTVTNIEILTSSEAETGALEVPVLSLVEEGNQVTLAWETVPNASGYTLFYAPYPIPDPVKSLDVADLNRLSFDGNGLAYYFAIQARADSRLSPYSNIVFFNLLE